jgi:hypothetical protein
MSIVARGLGHPGGLMVTLGLGRTFQVTVYNLTASTAIIFNQKALTGLPGPLRRIAISARTNPIYNLEMIVRILGDL